MQSLLFFRVQRQEGKGENEGMGGGLKQVFKYETLEKIVTIDLTSCPIVAGVSVFVAMNISTVTYRRIKRRRYC